MQRFPNDQKWMIQVPRKSPDTGSIRNMYHKAMTFISARLPRLAGTVFADRDCAPKDADTAVVSR
jgi:hypothetical protein